MIKVSDYMENTINVFGSVADRSPLMQSTKSAVQLLMGTWALSAVVFSGVYSGVLLKHMLCVEYSLPFNDMRSLAKVCKIKLPFDHAVQQGLMYRSSSNGLYIWFKSFRNAVHWDSLKTSRLPHI